MLPEPTLKHQMPRTIKPPTASPQACWRTRQTINTLFDILPEFASSVSHPVTRSMLLRWQGKPYASWDTPDKQHGDEGLSHLILAIYHDRPDLQAAFDISQAQGRSKLFCWYLQSGRKELQITWDAPEWQRYALAELDPRIAEDPALPVSRLMAHLWFGRPATQRQYPLQDRIQRSRFLAWFYFVWLAEEDFVSFLLPQQFAWLLKTLPGSRLRRDAWLLWRYLPELAKNFPLADANATVKYIDWFALHGNATLRSIQTRKRALQAGRAGPQRLFPAPQAPGVNLIGFAFGELGIGEDLRSAVLCLEQTGIAFSIFNVAPGANVSQQDTSLQGRVSDDLPYDINVFCITGMETVRMFLLYGRSMFDGRYNIGWWPWELPVWPTAWADAYLLVDEIWAATRYTAEAYRKSAPMLVRQVPLAVTLQAATEASQSLDRSHFGLPGQVYLFYFSFDFNSTLERKNPWTTLAAFRAAFPLGQEDVGLVIKVMHTSPDNPAWQQLQATIAQDRRIILIDQSLRRSELLALYNACDCYVSLHRAEGFGRGVAEAMLQGKQVIVSDYSGTKDFAYGPQVHPIKGRLIRIKTKDYPGATGKEYWFDASQAQVAQVMKTLAKTRPRTGLPDPAQASGCSRLGVNFVAQEVQAALTQARQLLNSDGSSI